MNEYQIISSGENPEEINLWIGKHGTARKLPDLEARIPAQRATIATWHIALDGETPDQKRHYGLSVYHLRDLQGAVSAKKLHPNASHEFFLVPLKENPLSNPDNPLSWEILQPVAQSQIANLTDNDAELMASLIAHGCVEGLLPVPKPNQWIKWGPYIEEFYESYGREK